IELVRTLRPSFPAAAPAAVLTCPNAPNRTFPSERPIASLMSLVSRLPEAPTSVPATMSEKLFSVNPLAATARPVNAFNSEITTGMSAPPGQFADPSFEQISIVPGSAAGHPSSYSWLFNDQAGLESNGSGLGSG